MEELSMKCYMHSDADGKSSGQIVMQHTGNRNKDDYFIVNYEDDVADKFDLAKEGEEIWIVDYSISVETRGILNKLLKKNCKIHWCDHHKTTFDLLEEYPEYDEIPGKRDKRWSGVFLTFQYCFPDKEVPRYIELISDYDTWSKKYKESNWLSYGLIARDMMECSQKLFDESEAAESGDDVMNAKIDDSNLPYLTELINNGKAIEEYMIQINKMTMNSLSFECEFEGHTILVVDNNSNSFVFGDQIKDYPFVGIFSYNGDEYKYSLYSHNPEKIDCSEIAKKYGGGGHPGAAGFRSKKLHFIKRD